MKTIEELNQSVEHLLNGTAEPCSCNIKKVRAEIMHFQILANLNCCNALLTQLYNKHRRLPSKGQIGRRVRIAVKINNWNDCTYSVTRDKWRSNLKSDLPYVPTDAQSAQGYRGASLCHLMRILIPWPQRVWNRRKMTWTQLKCMSLTVVMLQSENDHTFW